MSLLDPPCVLSVPTCCSAVRPGSWYSIILCSAVTVTSLKEAGRRRRCVKLRGLSAFSSSSSPFSFCAETPGRVWLKMQRAVSGSHNRSMPSKKKGGIWVTGTHTHCKSLLKWTFAASGDEMQLRFLYSDLREILIFGKNNSTLHCLPRKKAHTNMELQSFPTNMKIVLTFTALPHRLV